MDVPKNYMETVVMEVIDYAMQTAGCCLCPACRLDVAALALNNLQPRYVSTRDTYAKLNILRHQFTIDVLTQVIKAAEVVSKNPKHDKDGKYGNPL